MDHAPESSRLDKLHNIEKLGLDPWGHRLDGLQPIQAILQLPADLPEGSYTASIARWRAPASVYMKC